MKKYKRSDDFLLKNVAGDHVLIARGTNAIDFSSVVLFNDTGIFLWENMKDYLTADQIAELLAEKYMIPKENALKDVEAFLCKMETEGMIISRED